jgi:hypothetical protein
MDCLETHLRQRNCPTDMWLVGHARQRRRQQQQPPHPTRLPAVGAASVLAHRICADPELSTPAPWGVVLLGCCCCCRPRHSSGWTGTGTGAGSGSAVVISIH